MIEEDACQGSRGRCAGAGAGSGCAAIAIGQLCVGRQPRGRG